MSENFDTQKKTEHFSENKINPSMEARELNEWYILRNNNHLGPYLKKEILEYFYQGAINEYSLIWKEGQDDWLPLKKVDEIFSILKPSDDNNLSLPDLPDMRLIELEAQRELEQEIPPPTIKKTVIIDSKKRELIGERYERDSKNQSTSGEVVKDCDLRKQKIYQSSFDAEADEFKGSKAFDITGTRVSLPPLPKEDELVDIFETKEEKQVKEIIATSESSDSASTAVASHEMLIERGVNRSFNSVLLVGLAALFVTIPLFYIIISNRPVIHHIDGMSKEGLRRINTATSEMYNRREVVLNLSMTNASLIYAGINRSGKFEVKGLLTPIKNKTAGQLNGPIILSGESKAGLIKFNKDESLDKSVPIGKYKINLNFIDVSNLGHVYMLAQEISFLQNIGFIKNYQNSFSIQKEVWLGPNSIFLTKRRTEEYQKQRWANMNRPFDELFQQYDTLISLMDRFNEIFFNATTLKTFEKSKIVFSRKYGREVAPILQMIGMEEISDQRIKELELPLAFEDVYREGFLLAQSVSKSMIATAGDIDLFLSVKKNWNRFIRIEQRNRVNKKLISFRRTINQARQELEQKMKSLKAQ